MPTFTRSFVRRSLLIVCIPTGFAAAQVTLVVPTNYPTIQAAIQAALPGDTVLVLPGTYLERTDFLGKAIVVRSSAGATATTIDGNQAGTVVTFTTNEPPTAVLEGFTIRNGRGLTAAAGGIQCTGASPTIRACLVTANTGRAGGTGGDGGAGGIQAVTSALCLFDCDVRGNIGGNGGSNPAGVGGKGGAGGAYLAPTGTAPDVRRCRFDGNRGGDGGTGTTGGPTFGRGGCGGVEMYTIAQSNRFAACEFKNNIGGNGGTGSGGVGGFDLYGPTALFQAALTLENCIAVGNRGGNGGTSAISVGGHGGGTVATGAVVFTATFTTIAGNASGLPVAVGQVTGGLLVGGWMISSAALRNCILWGNTRAGAPSDLTVSGIAAQVSTSDIGASSGTAFGAGNLAVDPLFVNLANGDAHLTAVSPCRHAGAALATMPAFDLDGDPRTVGPAPDMGADEWDGLVGSREDFVLSLSVNGAFAPAVVTSTAAAGDFVAVNVRSPEGTFANDFAVLLMEPWLPPFAPSGPVLFPELQVPLAATWLVTYGAGVGAAGSTLGVAVPPGLSGFALRLQAVAVSPAARNTLFAATAARDLIL